MAKEEYKIGQTQYGKQEGPSSPGMSGSTEKAQNSKGTWGKLLRYGKKYWIPVILALIFAVAGTVFTIIGPDKLSDMTDIITEGITPNTEKLEEISGEISENMSVNMETVMGAISANLSDPNAVPEEIEVNGSAISAEDQMETVSLFSGLDMNDNEAAMQAVNNLPESVKSALYTDITVDGNVIPGEDQIEMMELFSEMDSDDSDAMLNMLDELPASIYDMVEPKIDMDGVIGIAILLIVFYVLSAVLSSGQGIIMATVSQKISKRLRSDISTKINRLPMSYYGRTSTADILSRITNDVDTLGQSLNQSVGTLVSSVALLVGSLVMMFATNWIMAVTAVISSLIGFALMMIIMSRSQKYFTSQQKALGEINGHIEEIYAGHTVVKAYNGEAEAKRTFDKMNENLRVSGFKSQCLSGLMMPIMSFIGNFAYVAVCVAGAVLAKNGTITFGVIVAFMMYVRQFTQPLSQIAQGAQSLQSATAAGERVFDFLDAEEMEDESDKPVLIKKAQGRVDFEHVRFGYDSDKVIIKDFSAKVKPGQKIAIVGPTGAGKTTIVNLLMRFYDIQGGKIKIDGVPTDKMKREDVHSMFCMVLQDTWLFEGTVRENLVYCTPDVSEEKMRNACKSVGLDHFIRTLPKGYDTVLNDQVNLSQGQKQQLTIARAMIADKPMLILDEATSSVDTRTELQIQNAMDELMKGRTSFIIAHRLSTIKNADLILVLKDGDVIESGNHDQLMKKNGFYADLYNSQFEQAS